jgi:hypothetical protein
MIPPDMTRKQLIEDLTRAEEWEANGARVTRKCLAHVYRGQAFAGVMYSVHERQHAGDSPVRYILVHLLRYYPELRSWGSKSMEESMFPYYFGCPVSYLLFAPVVECAEWRARVYEAHGRQQARARATRAYRKAHLASA